MQRSIVGFRDAYWDVLHKRARRIVFVGDSFVEALMADDDATIPAGFPGQVSDYYIPFKHRFGSRDVTSMSGPQFQGQAAHLGEVAARLAVPFLDLTPQIRARETAGEHLYWDYDHHFRPAGYAFVADALYAWAAAPAAK